MPDHEPFEGSAWTIRLAAAAFWTLAGALPAPAAAQTFELEIASIEVEKPRPVAAAVRELAARHGLGRPFEIRDEGGMFHVVPLEVLDAAGRPVPHVSPFDLPIHLPYERRTILDTLKAILTAVCGVSDTPVSMGLVWIEPFERLTVETGSQGRTARELLTDTMTVERLKTSWLLFYDPRLEQYFFSVYPVRAPRARPKEG